MRSLKPGPAGYEAKPGLSCRELDGSLILRDPSTGGILHLNPVAGLIFCLCDGEHDQEAIYRELKQVFPRENEQRLREDLSRTLEQLKHEQVIVGSDGG